MSAHNNLLLSFFIIFTFNQSAARSIKPEVASVKRPSVASDVAPSVSTASDQHTDYLMATLLPTWQQVLHSFQKVSVSFRVLLFQLIRRAGNDRKKEKTIIKNNESLTS